MVIQYRHLIPAPVDRTSVMDNMTKRQTSTSMAHVACESKLRLLVRSSMHPCPGNWVAIGCAVVYYARSTHTFSAVIKCCIVGISCIHVGGGPFDIQREAGGGGGGGGILM